MSKSLAVMVMVAALACPVGSAARSEQEGTAVAAASFASARSYFDGARKMGFPAAGQSKAYVLEAKFTTRSSSGAVETGTYTDTWVSSTKWRREAALGQSKFVRSQDGKKRFRAGDGPDLALLQFVLTAMEPLPATDALFAEQDWKVKRDTVDGAVLTRVATAREGAEVAPDAKEFYGFWFDEAGQLVKSRGNGLETRRMDFSDFNGVKVARRVEVTMGGKVGMRIDVKELGPAGKVDGHMFSMKGREWVRQYTFEVR